MLTAKDAVQDRVTGLDSGADDYLVKPFEFDELLARIRALSRRNYAPILEEKVNLHGLVLNRTNFTGHQDEEEIQFTPREFQLLDFLAQNKGRVLAREVILDRIWGYDTEVSNKTVDATIKLIRRKLEKFEKQDLIQSIHGWGIKLIADFITRLRYRWKRDLFKQTQNRLTLLDSGLIIFFLMFFITIVYSLFYVLISNQEEDSIQNLADQELGVVKNFLKQDGRVNPRWGEAQNVIVIGEDQFFYYVVNPAGGLIMGDEVVGPLRPDLLNLLQGWMPEKNELRYETLRFHFENPWSNDERQTSEEREIRLLMTGRPIIYGNQIVEILYVGKNITRNVELFQWLLYLFIGLAIVFSGMAIFLSHILSKRTMVPIIRSYTRQRQFAADASHELRTPLSVLFSSVDALELEQDIEGKEKDSFSRKLLANMKDEIKRMTTLVGDLLTLARSDSDQPELLWQTFDYRLQVEKIIQSLAPLAEAKDIHFCLHALPSLVVHGDEERVKYSRGE